MTIESFSGETPAYVAHVTMHRSRRCDVCGVLLRRGAHARLAASESRRKRRILCMTCSPETAPAADASSVAAGLLAMSVPAIPEIAGTTPVSVTFRLAVGVLGVGALLASRTGRRLLTTTGVALKAAASGVGERIRGRDNVGPPALRRAFEDLGPTYVKLGQLVGSCEGLFPEPY